MVFENIFSYISLAIYLVLFFIVYGYVKKIITTNGFNILSVFILTFSIFYFVVPFIQTFFKLYRDDTSLYTMLLNQLSDEEIFFNLLICFICLVVIILSYNLRLKSDNKIINNNVINGKNYNVETDTLYKKIVLISNVIFVVGVLCIILLINEVGSLKAYLSLGSLTRGLDKNPTDYIRSSYLQLITLSTIILVSPYLFLYLYRIKKNKINAISFWISMIFAILFLLYNQGRAPLIIFFLPFLFSFSKRRKKGLFGLVVLFIAGLIILNYLDSLFNYLSYGYYKVNEDKRNIITDFLREFSYPFTNFILRHDLIAYSGYRYMYDYIIWPFTIVPSSILGLIGISKESITAVSTLNTEAYGAFLGINPSGGIPVDLLTFNYYQFGYVTLIPMCFIIGRILNFLDKMFYFFKSNFAIKILLYRISFSMINIVNNADISAIIRNRLDIVVLLFITLYIYINQKRQYKLNLKKTNSYNKRKIIQ
jgi:oligosaccharide repeat unit polymerase